MFDKDIVIKINKTICACLTSRTVFAAEHYTCTDHHQKYYCSTIHIFVPACVTNPLLHSLHTKLHCIRPLNSLVDTYRRLVTWEPPLAFNTGLCRDLQLCAAPTCTNLHHILQHCMHLQQRAHILQHSSLHTVTCTTILNCVFLLTWEPPLVFNTGLCRDLQHSSLHTVTCTTIHNSVFYQPTSYLYQPAHLYQAARHLLHRKSFISTHHDPHHNI
jgi:hypothetical protein